MALWAGLRKGSGKRLARLQRRTTGKHLHLELKMSYLHPNALATALQDVVDAPILFPQS